jgi:hypothetical protein
VIGGLSGEGRRGLSDGKNWAIWIRVGEAKQ